METRGEPHPVALAEFIDQCPHRVVLQAAAQDFSDLDFHPWNGNDSPSRVLLVFHSRLRRLPRSRSGCTATNAEDLACSRCPLLRAQTAPIGIPRDTGIHAPARSSSP